LSGFALPSGSRRQGRKFILDEGERVQLTVTLEALAHIAATAYDVVVLDRDLPGVHGDDV
jgi:CheY-like chemotaxis protein